MNNQKYNHPDRPILMYWELTRSCDLACQHCRAEAMTDRSPFELSTDECKALIREVKNFGQPTPHVIITGGDPLKRPDLPEITSYFKACGVSWSIAPSATHLLTDGYLKMFKDHGVQAMSLSIDGSNPETHDGIRQVEGCFEETIDRIARVNAMNLPLQINTLVCEETADDLPKIAELLSKYDVLRWSLFFLVSVGRGKQLTPLTPEASEGVLEWVAEHSDQFPFPVKTTEAPHYRRVVLQKYSDYPAAKQVRRGYGIRDGNGIMFVSHTGIVNPSGFLPAVAGNVRTRSVVDIYRNSDLFREIRNVEEYAGKCGYCEFRNLCGGSRSRAYSATGDWQESDPLCVYQPVEKGAIHAEV